MARQKWTGDKFEQTNKQSKLDLSQNLKQLRDKTEQVADSPLYPFLPFVEWSLNNQNGEKVIQTIKQTNKQWRDKNEQVADSSSDEFFH